MRENEFAEKVELFRGHVDRLNQMIDMLPEPQKDFLAKAFQGFNIALEELQVAEEELHQQNEQLFVAQNELIAERQRYLDLFEFAPNSYLVTDEEGIIQEANNAACGLLKHTQRGLVGKPLAIFIALSERRYFRKWIASLAQARSSEEDEFTIQPPDGQIVPVTITAAPFRNPSNDQLRLHWMLHDISSQVEANKLLKRTASRVQLLEDIASAANASNNIEQLLRFALEHICAHTGWPVGHVYLRHDQPNPVLIPTTIWHLDSPDQFAAFRQATENTRFGPDEGISGRVLSNRKPEWVPDITQIHGFERLSVPDDQPLKSGYFLPVLAGEKVAAVLEFFSGETQEPEAELQGLLAHIGEQLGRVFERVDSERQLREEAGTSAQCHLGCTGQHFFAEFKRADSPFHGELNAAPPAFSGGPGSVDP